MLEFKNTKSLIYDLDGTLLDTVGDIANALNYGLNQNGFKVFSVQNIFNFIGGGIENLVKRALAEQQAQFESKVLDDVREYYAKHPCDESTPYDQIVETLEKLQSLGYDQSILSNKPHEFTGIVVQTLLPTIRFDVVWGAQPSFAKKPNPEGINKLIEHHKQGFQLT